MEPFTALIGVAAPLLEDNINTDEIAPFARDFDPDYAALFFSPRRSRLDGTENLEFVLNRPQFRSAKVLVTGENFGCGSSREFAVWAMAAFGIRCVVARSFADSYRENCLKNGLLPVSLSRTEAEHFEAAVVEIDGSSPLTVDLESQTIVGGCTSWSFLLSPSERSALLEGLDDISLSLRHTEEIVALERELSHSAPWLLQDPTPH